MAVFPAPVRCGERRLGGRQHSTARGKMSRPKGCTGRQMGIDRDPLGNQKRVLEHRQRLIGILFPLLFPDLIQLLAVDAERCRRAGLQAADADFDAASFAVTVFTYLQGVQGLIDLFD